MFASCLLVRKKNFQPDGRTLKPGSIKTQLTIRLRSLCWASITSEAEQLLRQHISTTYFYDAKYFFIKSVLIKSSPKFILMMSTVHKVWRMQTTTEGSLEFTVCPELFTQQVEDQTCGQRQEPLVSSAVERHLPLVVDCSLLPVVPER